MGSRRRFEIQAFVNPDQLRFGVTGKNYLLGSVPARHKWNRSDESPYCVPNEFVCAELGRAIGLPIPPYAITRLADGELAGRDIFSTLSFNWDGRDLSPVNAHCCLRSLPVACAGVIVFDVFVANADRHDENVAVDRTDSPKDLKVFDHDGALFGTDSGGGIARLNKLERFLGITGKAPTGGNTHVFLESIDTNKHFGVWIDRIAELPYGFIERICGDAKAYGISKEESERATKFLYERRLNLRGLLNRHKREFKGIASWPTL